VDGIAIVVGILVTLQEITEIGKLLDKEGD